MPTETTVDGDQQEPSLRLHLTDSNANMAGGTPTMTRPPPAPPSSTLPSYESSVQTSRALVPVQLRPEDANKSLPTTSSSDAESAEAAAIARKVLSSPADHTVGTHWPGNRSRDGQQCAYTSLHAMQAQNSIAFRLRQASQQEWPKLFHKIYIRPILDVDSANLKAIPDQGSPLENNLFLLAEEFRKFFATYLSTCGGNLLLGYFNN